MFASIHTARLATRGVQTGGSVQRLVATLRLGLAARRQRQALAQLDPHLLADVGVTPAEAEAEAMRPIWDVPSNWRR
ncbi:DUF1127 domain-containing protein [Cereibacter sphaeroides]|uniref:DUF1127 domain-containing protein n=1 Tax=Cereibacter sphaeroides TaxID=1063 RepID=UPI001F41A600|nr:DUF1127 domain-containing protein [Cereibacter sphaeroides]MCE6951914.1 DUF1127 domain-containing protein [Cereibacter sphaeroides]MCE6961226.1 DUF1127 domain-containing protein [Cereibacter sphaeroides]MCE6970212.1 DUF1127 domain-containing protein [Cereibacter sphaeroides]MCE6974049.1 DUF1127 domain-containing protein [Cereibacter sphaeroides]